MLGTGSIGQELLRILNDQGVLPNTRIGHVLDERPLTPLQRQLAERYDFQFHQSIESFLGSRSEFIVECTHPYVAKRLLLPLIHASNHVIVLSVGALADPQFLTQVHRACNLSGGNITLASGAIGGLDVLQAAAWGELSQVTLTTRKPPQALGIDNDTHEPVTIFSGTARDAWARYPQNMNVAISLALAGIGLDRTMVTVVADPSVTRNRHEVHVSGDFGTMQITLDNVPSPTNPKTSQLTVFSVLSTLKRLQSAMVIGG